MLAKLADLKTNLGITSSTEDARLTLALKSAQSAIEQHCCRRFEYVAVDQVQTFEGDAFDLLLPLYPIARSPLARPVVKIAYDLDFESANALTENEDYRCIDRRGRVSRLPDRTLWPYGGIVQVTWRGGYTDPAASPVDGVDTMPDDVQQACLIQAADCYNRRDEPGYKLVSGMPEGMSTGFAPELKLLEDVKLRVRSYCR